MVVSFYLKKKINKKQRNLVKKVPRYVLNSHFFADSVSLRRL